MTQRAYDPIKRVIDVLVAGVALVLTLPLQAVLAVLVRRNLGSPVLFRQERPGKDERIFEMVKFRTMLEPEPTRGLVSDEERLTKFGAFLRVTSLDELPTLWNVVKGEMSLVGPRPLLVSYLDRYTPEQRRRHDVRPGVTGLAQVKGRNAIGWDEKFTHDIIYVERRSLTLDLRILTRTVGRVLGRHGISDGEGPTMAEYLGSEGENRG